MAVAKYAWSGRERLGLLRVRDDVLVLHAMRWPDEIRDPTELLPPPTEVIAQIIEAKREEKPLPEAPEQPVQVLDLMAALQESVSRAKASRGDAGPADVHELPQPKKKAATKKQPAKQTGAKTTAGRRPRSA